VTSQGPATWARARKGISFGSRAPTGPTCALHFRSAQPFAAASLTLSRVATFLLLPASMPRKLSIFPEGRNVVFLWDPNPETMMKVIWLSNPGLSAWDFSDEVLRADLCLTAHRCLFGTHIIAFFSFVLACRFRPTGSSPSGPPSSRIWRTECLTRS
jgi:hypothetical protein